MSKSKLLPDGTKAIKLADYRKACARFAEVLHDVTSELRKVEGILKGAANDTDQDCVTHRLKSLSGHTRTLWACVGVIGSSVRFVSLLKNQRIVTFPTE